MRFKNIQPGKLVLALAIVVVGAGCQKMDRPELGDYPKDTSPPGGPLKFYAAMNGSSVDSIRANFGEDENVTYVNGVSGQAMSVGDDGNITYTSPNDFKKSKSFTLSFWIRKEGPNPGGEGTAFVFGMGTSTDIWTGQDMFFMFEDANNPSTPQLAAAKLYVTDQWFEFVGDKRLPGILDGQWHHLAFTLDHTTSTLTTYIDGVPFTNLPSGFGNFTKNGGVPDLTHITNLVIGGPGGSAPADWMGNFNGEIDQFRLYDVALSAQEVAALFSGKR